MAFKFSGQRNKTNDKCLVGKQLLFNSTRKFFGIICEAQKSLNIGDVFAKAISYIGSYIAISYIGYKLN